MILKRLNAAAIRGAVILVIRPLAAIDHAIVRLRTWINPVGRQP